MPAGGSSASPEQIWGLLAAKLPRHMIPSAFVTLDALPLTPAGKLDRAALPEPASVSGSGSGFGDAAARPMNEREQAVAALFEEVLGRSGIGPGDDFFALGGHSLLATRLVARLRSTLGAEVGIRAVFEARTVAALAASIVDGTVGSARTRPALVRRAPKEN